jgi:3-deoxy-D-manno-octulosonic-acid transferase
MMMRALIRILSWLQTSFWMRLFGVRPERRNAFLESRFFNQPSTKDSVTWFHASSLGELEMLMPLIDDFHDRGEKIGVSAFSDSALRALQSLKPFAVYAELSPREEEWERLFHRFQVKKLILAKYDFWPGLLVAAAKTGSPVIVINAQMRKSLLRMIRLFQVLGSPFPKLYLAANDLASEGELKANLSENATVFFSVDPRWERVARRKSAPRKIVRVQEWSKQILALPKPIGFLGSAWTSDLEVVLPALVNQKGSLVIVPHDLSETHLRAIETWIKRFDLEKRTLVVNEMGILVELYQFADWAFVGGGFGKGVHSLLEPASYGIPVACGPNRYHEFKETKELTALGILTRCESTKDVERWMSEDHEIPKTDSWIEQKRNLYSALLEECLRIR